MNFLLVERKNDDEFFISGEEKVNDFFNVTIPVYHHEKIFL